MKKKFALIVFAFLSTLMFVGNDQSLSVSSPMAKTSSKQPEVLRVGPGMPYLTPSVAARFAKNGDVIEIIAGTYPGDVASWTQNDLTIRGIYGRARMIANGNHAEGKGIWVIKGNNVTVENIEFAGASVPDHNGAGIRFEGANLIIRGCYFHDNENGILTGKNAVSAILIENSEFADNGFGDGYTHNIYIGEINRLTVQFCYIHGAKSGHNVKSRAKVNHILYNRIMDEREGTSSYAIDISNGGSAYLLGNVIQQGALSENYHIISYGAEALSYPVNKLYVVNNTIINDRGDGGVFVRVAPGAAPAKLINNIFYGPGTIVNGPAMKTANLIIRKEQNPAANGRSPGFINPMEFDYRLMRGSPAIDAGNDPGADDGFDLTAKFQYIHVARSEKRVVSAVMDIGAFEYNGQIE